jgi:hypothetical protein
LKHRCLGPVGGTCPPDALQQPSKIDIFVFEILAGCCAAFVASVFGIRKLRKIKKERQTSKRNGISVL